MSARVTLRITLADGTPAENVRVLARNRDAWDKNVAEWHGVTGRDGVWTWPNLDTGTAGDFYDFYAEMVDDLGVSWAARASDRIGSPRDIPIRLLPTYSGQLAIPESAVRYLEGTSDGRSILASLEELKRAVGNGMIQGTITLSTYVIEGLIRVVAKARNVWSETWDRKTYSELLEVPQILGLFPASVKDRARALADLRRPSAHYKYTTSLPAEAQIAAKTVEDIVAAWCKANPGS